MLKLVQNNKYYKKMRWLIFDGHSFPVILVRGSMYWMPCSWGFTDQNW